MTSKPISILAVLLLAASGGMVPPAQAQEDKTPCERGYYYDI